MALPHKASAPIMSVRPNAVPSATASVRLKKSNVQPARQQPKPSVRQLPQPRLNDALPNSVSRKLRRHKLP